ncbi:hypothetical protein WQ54_28125 [Bacillus sp. SA1-12]|uniref:hypothetical protein n=1 Tax=Bacillus sp. SA1-12 TaxID=1455638 RepID=UPI000627347F|nr:hypothetical protein [Bacillus sp. SA1-12]KKI89093.1 hypothetical protein WQ54_28125 [Bacillus sp. SA1-12]
MQQRVIDSVINQLLLRSGSSADVIVESAFPDGRLVGGKYHLGTHTITLYLNEIKKQCEQLFATDQYFLDYLTIVTAHELGHAEDQELEELCDQLDECPTQVERDKISLRIEENAWRYARSILSGIETNIVETVIFHSLKPYYEEIDQEIA